MFDLIQLRCFTAVATELNFSRAAERLNMTQPPLSRQIQLLEHQLGVALFIRSTRSVALTAAGRAFFVEAQSLLERAQLATLAAKRFAQGDIGAVSVSFLPSAVYEFLPRVIAEARVGQPDIDISLSEMNTYEQHEALCSRRIDLGIVRQAMRQDGFVSERLIREPFVLAVPLAHPLANAPQVSVADLHEQAFIMYSHSAWQPFNELLTGMFRSEKITPRYVQWLGSTLTILALVNAAMGLALVPRSARRIRFENVIYRDLGPGTGDRERAAPDLARRQRQPCLPHDAGSHSQRRLAQWPIARSGGQGQHLRDPRGEGVIQHPHFTNRVIAQTAVHQSLSNVQTTRHRCGLKPPVVGDSVVAQRIELDDANERG